MDLNLIPPGAMDVTLQSLEESVGAASSNSELAAEKYPLLSL